MIHILGAGAFGTALAISLSRNGTPVTLIARDAGLAQSMHRDRVNATRLPDMRFPDALGVTSTLEITGDRATILLAVPMQKLRAALRDHAAQLAGHRLVACCKGIELTTGLGPAQVIAQEIPDALPALLTGPSFARDIAAGLPTALTLACGDDGAGAALQQSLSTQNLRLYRTTDVPGAEVGGAMKNVVAIACGATMGAGLGESARAALMTRGFAEMLRLALARGARGETLSGLSGFGDLTLTCTSTQSRNYAYGMALGRGDGFDASVTVEGAATARAVRDLAAQSGIDMPITGVVVALIAGEIDMARALDMLLSRPLTTE